jgi:DNA-binding response OmpR family regulator
MHNDESDSMSEKTVLIVDDNEEFAEFVRDAAEQLSYRSVILTDSRQFSTLFERVKPDILVLDIVMPNVEGTEIVQWLINQEARARVILVSGSNPLYSRIAKTLGEARGLGPVTVLQKPVRLEALRDALSAAV